MPHSSRGSRRGLVVRPQEHNISAFWLWSTCNAEEGGNRLVGSPNCNSLTRTVLCLFSGTNEGHSVP